MHVSGKRHIGVVGSETDILGPVGKFVLAFLEMCGVVDWNVNNVSRGWVLDSLALDVLNLLDDSGVEEVLWEHLIWWWQDYSLGVFTFQDGRGQSLQ